MRGERERRAGRCAATTRQTGGSSMPPCPPGLPALTWSNRMSDLPSDLPRRRLKQEEYQQQLALVRDIAAAAQDAARLCQTFWDVPDCLINIINAFLDLDRLLFPEGLAWDARVD